MKVLLFGFKYKIREGFNHILFFEMRFPAAQRSLVHTSHTCSPSFSSPVSRSQVSSHQQEVLMENITQMSERSRLQSLGEASKEADLLENIWKLENLFQNHSDWLQRLEILIKVRQTV